VSGFGVNPAQTTSSLYRRYGPAIYARCRRLLRDDSLAEDATQEVFVRVLKHIEKAGPDDALKWIYRLSTNWCLNALRDRARQAQPVAQVPDVAGPSPEPDWNDKATSLTLVLRAPEKLRPFALLHYVDGLEHQQIADTLSVSRRTVINRLNEFLALTRAETARSAA